MLKDNGLKFLSHFLQAPADITAKKFGLTNLSEWITFALKFWRQIQMLVHNYIDEKKIILIN